MDRLITMFQDGGEFMYPLLVFFVFAMAIACERLFYLRFRAHINATAFMAQIQKLIMANNIDRAIKICNAEPNAALARVVKAGLLRANGPKSDIETAVEEATLEVGASITKRVPFLGMLANVATLTGLLGTIWGLIMAFEAVAKASAEMKQTLLAQGISVAMYTTAGGLTVAIPTLLLQSIVTAFATRVLEDVDQYGLKTVDLLAQRRPGSQAQAAEG